MWRAETTLLDDDWPAFPAAPAGSLLDGGTLSGVQRVSTIATDKGGGIAATSLEVDGQVVTRATLGDSAGSCREPYTTRVPCPTTASGTLTLDTAQLPDGVHRLRVLATDAAGNTSAWGPATFSSDNSQALCAPAPTPAGTPLQLRTWIEPEARPAKAKPKAKAKSKPKSKKRRKHARAAAARPRTVTVAIGRATVVSGELTDAAGAPVAGAAVCVSSRVGDGGALTPLARLTTDAGGRFSARVPAGTSRQVWAVHRVAGGAVSARTLVRVRARLSLRPARRSLRAGQVLTMRGRLAGRPIPADGVLVNVQARRGRQWQTFRQVRVHDSGRFRVRYRFVGGGGTHRYALRATVPQQGAYPYAPGSSKPFRVRVRG
jgi:5-hydroxyisourate hydrolase-like protein (transthyretin family)